MSKIPTLEQAMLAGLGGPITDLAALPDVAEARRSWAEVRARFGFGPSAALLTAPAGNVKLGKSAVPIFGLTLAPADQSGVVNACPWATPACRAACVLVTAGKGSMPNVIAARNARTVFAAEAPAAFVALVAYEIGRAVAKYGAVRVRLNVASDVRWERVAPALLAIPGATFYDYTKAPATARPDVDGYPLTRSASERTSVADIAANVAAGRNVAVVLAIPRNAAIPATWQGLPTIDGDPNEDRYSDPRGVVVALRAKGSAVGDTSGFVKAAY